MLARRWYLLAVLTCSYGLGAFGMLGVSPLSPALMHGFALSRLEVAVGGAAIHRECALTRYADDS